jgi:hypothetical protein
MDEVTFTLIVVAIVVVVAFAAIYLDRWLMNEVKRLHSPAEPTTVLVPEVLIMHEHPQAYWHYETGPHAKCDCRVCGLQRKVKDEVSISPER